MKEKKTFKVTIDNLNRRQADSIREFLNSEEFAVASQEHWDEGVEATPCGPFDPSKYAIPSRTNVDCAGEVLGMLTRMGIPFGFDTNSPRGCNEPKIVHIVVDNKVHRLTLHPTVGFGIDGYPIYDRYRISAWEWEESPGAKLFDLVRCYISEMYDF